MLASEDPDYRGEPDVAAAEILGYAMMMAADRQANPRDDILTKLITADKDGHKLTDDEFGYFVILLTVAGNETTRNAITHGMNAFLDNPDQWELWKKERPAEMVDEVIRWATPVTVFQRTALEDIEVGDLTIKKGQRAALFYASANHDDRRVRRAVHASTSPARRTRTSPSAATAPTTASAPTWPARRCGWSSTPSPTTAPTSPSSPSRAGSATPGSTASRTCRSSTPEGAAAGIPGRPGIPAPDG